MQDKYAGDVGDFGKFVFLKHLADLSPGTQLGVNWYRTTRPERSSNDGRHVSYLDARRPDSRRFRGCDPRIFGLLADVVKNGRSVAALERSGVLPRATRYYSAPIPFASTGAQARLEERAAWFTRSLSPLRGCSVLFLDPDNGIQPAAARKSEPRAIKYAFLDEMRLYFEQSEILVVYHHRDRAGHASYAAKFLGARRGVSPSARMRVLRFRRFSVRDYVFLYRAGSEKTVNALFSAMTKPPYDFLFGEFTP
jgi:hypothetical protein